VGTLLNAPDPLTFCGESARGSADYPMPPMSNASWAMSRWGMSP